MRIDDVIVGVASDQPRIRDALAHVLRLHVTDEAIEEPNYTVHVADDMSGFHRIAWGGCVVVRTRDPARLGGALARHIAGHGGPPDGQIRTGALAVVRENRAWLLPVALRRRIARYETALRKHGFIVEYGPWADVHPGTGELVVPRPAIDPAPLVDVFAQATERGPTEPSVPAGRYELAGWVFAGAQSEGPMAPDEVVANVLSELPEPLGRGCSSLFADLVKMLRHVEVRSLAIEPPRSLARTLSELA